MPSSRPQGEVEEDFEAMAAAVHNLAPHLEIDLEMEVAPSKRLRPVEAVRKRALEPISNPPAPRVQPTQPRVYSATCSEWLQG